MSTSTTLGYSDFVPKTISEDDAKWEQKRSTLLKLLGCDETPLKSKCLEAATYHYSKEHNFLIKLDNANQQRVSITQKEVDEISALNNLPEPRF